MFDLNTVAFNCTGNSCTCRVPSFYIFPHVHATIPMLHSKAKALLCTEMQKSRDQSVARGVTLTVL